MKELIMIQQGLQAPKSRKNTFGGYNYRSCEDILEAVKPLLADQDCTLTLSDELCHIGDRYYVQATARLTNNSGETISVTALAREAETKKGMDEAQVTGAASSYARKYALNGLFAIDDTKDADTDTYTRTSIHTQIRNAKTIDELSKLWLTEYEKDGALKEAFTAKKHQLKGGNNGKA
jgi:hypothetical protein